MVSNGTSLAPETFELDLAGLEELRKRVAHVEDASYPLPTPPIQDQQEDEEDVHMEVGEDLVDDRDGDEDEEEEEESVSLLSCMSDTIMQITNVHPCTLHAYINEYRTSRSLWKKHCQCARWTFGPTRQVSSHSYPSANPRHQVLQRL